MKFRILVTSLAIGIVGFAHAQITSIGPMYGRNWYVSNDYMHPAGARALAASIGGTLATVKSAQEQVWLNNLFPSSTYLWIGISDRAVEGTFVWDDGSPVTYTNWGIGEPSNSEGVEDSVIMNCGGGGAWNDWKVSDYARALITVNPVPEPAPLLPLAFGILAFLRRSRRSHGK